MSDIQPTAEPADDEHEGCGCPPPESPVRYVLQQLPPPSIEAFQRSRHRGQKRADLYIFVLMAGMTLFYVGVTAFDIAAGDASAIYSSVLTLLYACFAGFLAFKGGPGMRGEYHQVHVNNCAIALEDYQEEVFGHKHQHGDLGNIPGEMVPEYLRLLRLTRDAYEHAHGLRQRLDKIKFHGMDPEMIVDDGRLPGWPVKDDHVD